MSLDALGKWYCQLVDQEQSEAEAEAHGEYDDAGGSREQNASKTEYANATLELFEDGRYALVAQDHNSSHGTWAVDPQGGLTVTESDDCINGFDGLEWVNAGDDRFVVGFKLNDDSHDGLDILVLTFGREAPKPKAAKPEGFVARLLEVQDEDETWDILNAALDKKKDRKARALELWDAWVGGQIAADPDSEDHWLHTQAFGDERIIEAGGFLHRHARHAFETLKYDRDREMFNTILDMLPTLPVDDGADAELAPLLVSALEGKWLEQLTRSRFAGGGTPDALFERPLIPRTVADEQARAYLASPRVTYSRFEAIEGLYPPGHPDLAKVVIRYRGRGVLLTPLALIEAREIEAEVLAAALTWLEEHSSTLAFVGASPGLSAMMFAVLFLVRDGKGLPSVVVEGLGAEIKTSVSGSLWDEGKVMLREVAAKLPEDQRVLVHKRFWLDPKK